MGGVSCCDLSKVRKNLKRKSVLIKLVPLTMLVCALIIIGGIAYTINTSDDYKSEKCRTTDIQREFAMIPNSDRCNQKLGTDTEYNPYRRNYVVNDYDIVESDCYRVCANLIPIDPVSLDDFGGSGTTDETGETGETGGASGTNGNNGTNGTNQTSVVTPPSIVMNFHNRTCSDILVGDAELQEHFQKLHQNDNVVDCWKTVDTELNCSQNQCVIIADIGYSYDSPELIAANTALIAWSGSLFVLCLCVAFSKNIRKGCTQFFCHFDVCTDAYWKKHEIVCGCCCGGSPFCFGFVLFGFLVAVIWVSVNTFGAYDNCMCTIISNNVQECEYGKGYEMNTTVIVNCDAVESGVSDILSYSESTCVGSAQYAKTQLVGGLIPGYVVPCYAEMKTNDDVPPSHRSNGLNVGIDNVRFFANQDPPKILLICTLVSAAITSMGCCFCIVKNGQRKCGPCDMWESRKYCY